MTATNIQPDSRQILGGDRFYTAVRLVILTVLLIIGVRLTGISFWPPVQQATPAVVVWWAYAAFGLLTVIALLLPGLRGLLPWSVLGDFTFLALLTVLIGRQPGDVRPEFFYPLYLLPAISGSLRRRPLNGLGAGLVAALCYGAAVVIAHQQTDTAMQPIDYVWLLVNSMTLVLISLLTGTLAERWSAAKWALVDQARAEAAKALQDAEAYRDRTRSLYEVAYALGSTSNYENVLDTALTESQRLAHAQTSMALLSSGQPNEVYVAAGRGLRENDLHQRIQIGEGAIAQTLLSGEPRLIPDASQEPELQRIAAMQRCHSTCCVPLTAGRRTYGVILVASNDHNAYGPEQMSMVETLAKFAIVALINAQLIQELREERTKLISREEEVRQQLNRDLHDGPAQALAALTMNIEFVRRLLERDPERVQTELEKMRELAQRTTKQVRTLLFELRPLTLDSQGLVATLEEYLARFKDNATQIIYDPGSVDVHLDSKRQATIFNIVQESVNNAIKHAQAQHIWVRLRQEGDTLMATIQDDGRGFDLAGTRANYNQRGSFGLLNIEERARLVGGSAEMHSAPGTGTTVRVMVPISDMAI